VVPSAQPCATAAVVPPTGLVLTAVEQGHPTAAAARERARAGENEAGQEVLLEHQLVLLGSGGWAGVQVLFACCSSLEPEQRNCAHSSLTLVYNFNNNVKT